MIDKSISYFIIADNTDFEGLSPYDMADMLKQYFRELPEPILTSKLAETFISIFSSKYSRRGVKPTYCTIV